MPDEGGLWYVLLINRARAGDHWLLKRLGDDQVRANRQAVRARRAMPHPVRTRSYRSAASFDDEAQARHFLRSCGYLPRGYLAEVVRILPPRARRRPAQRRLDTPYGPVVLLEGQLCLFGEETT